MTIRNLWVFKTPLISECQQFNKIPKNPSFPHLLSSSCQSKPCCLCNEDKDDRPNQLGHKFPNNGEEIDFPKSANHLDPHLCRFLFILLMNVESSTGGSPKDKKNSSGKSKSLGTWFYFYRRIFQNYFLQGLHMQGPKMAFQVWMAADILLVLYPLSLVGSLSIRESQRQFK